MQTFYFYDNAAGNCPLLVSYAEAKKLEEKGLLQDVSLRHTLRARHLQDAMKKLKLVQKQIQLG